METPHRRLFSTSTCLIVFYCFVTILYFGWAILPVRAHPLFETLPPTPSTKTPKPTKTPTITQTPTLAPDATATMTYTPAATTSVTPTTADMATETPTLVAGTTATNTTTLTASPTSTASPTPINTDTQNPTTTPTPTEIMALTPTPTVANAVVVLTKTAFLFSDVDQNNLVSPGDKLLYVITVLNKGKVSAQQFRLEDTLDPNTTLVSGTLKTDKGTVRQGNNAGDTQVIIEFGTFGPGERATMSLQVSIKRQVNDTQVQNQAVATFANQVNGLSEQTTVISDDPATTESLDATITPLNGNQPRPARKVFIPFVAHQR